MERLETLIPKEKVEELVIGLPKQLNNEDAHITQNVYRLKEALENKCTGVKIALITE